MSKFVRACTPLDEESLPWERYREESPLAFEGFVAYRSLPRVDRSVRAAYLAKQGSHGLPTNSSEDCAPSGWYRWADRFKWKERVLAFDSANERRDLEAEADERVRSRRLRRAVLVSALRKAGNDLPTVDFSKSSASDLAKFLEVVVRQLREEYDETPTQKVALGGLRTESGVDIPIVITQSQSKV
jgi:hypothetical protein